MPRITGCLQKEIKDNFIKNKKTPFIQLSHTMGYIPQKQVSYRAYSFQRYMHLERWNSVHYQISEVMNLKPKTVLEIGPGTGVFKSELERNQISCTTLDIAEDTKPDVVGSVTKIPLEDNSFDVVCAFQVLEHIPFELFPTALSEMMRVAERAIVISLPHFGPNIKFMCKFPGLPKLQWAKKVPYPKPHEFDGQHYWEIGKKGYGYKKVKRILEGAGEVTRDYIPFENSFHHFFVIKK